MKIIITESQYKFLKKTILIESSDDVSTYVTKKIVGYMLNQESA